MNELVLKKPIPAEDQKTITLDVSNQGDEVEIDMSSEELEGKGIKFKVIKNPELEYQNIFLNIHGPIKDAYIGCYDHEFDVDECDILIVADNIPVNGNEVKFTDLEINTGMAAD